MKGFSSKNKNAVGVKNEHVTVGLIGPNKHGMDVNAAQYVTEVTASDIVDAIADGRTITAAAHGARVGDVIRFLTGNATGSEVKVNEVVDVNNFNIDAPFVDDLLSLAPVATDTFALLRHRSPSVNDFGAITTGPVQFIRDSVATTVTEDTGTPANNRPFPVSIVGTDGTVTIDATNLHLNVQLAHNGATPDSTQLGDGTNLLKVSVRDTVAGAADSGLQAMAVRSDAGGTLVGADGDLSPIQVDGTGALRVTGGGGGSEFAEGSVYAASSLGAQAQGVRKDSAGPLAGVADGDVTPSLYDSAGNLRVAVISGGGGGTEFAEDAASTPGDLGAQMLVVRQDALASSTSADGDYTPLKSNAAGSLYANLSESLPAGTNNIGDVDVLSLPSLPAGTNNIGDVDVLSLPALPAGTNNIGDVDVLTAPGTFAEDSASADGHTGYNNLSVRQDAIAVSTTTDGDYQPHKSNSVGSLYVNLSESLPAGTNNIGDVDVLTLPALPAGTNNIGDVDVLTMPGQFARDVAAGAADLGSMALAVRDDAGGSQVSTDGDYSPLSLNAAGELRVNTGGGGGGGTEFAEGSAYIASSLGGLGQLVRKDTAGPLTGVAANDVTPALVNSNGDVRVSINSISSNLNLNRLKVVDYMDGVGVTGQKPASLASAATGSVLVASTAAIIKRIEIIYAPIDESTNPPADIDFQFTLWHTVASDPGLASANHILVGNFYRACWSETSLGNSTSQTESRVIYDNISDIPAGVSIDGRADASHAVPGGMDWCILFYGDQ